MSGDRQPTDADIESILRAATADAWSELGAAAAELEAEDEGEHMTWDGGQQTATTVVDGVERPVIQMPYAVYSPAVDRTLRALAGLGAIVPFRWPEWSGVQDYRGPDALDAAPVADAVRMVTAIVRAERFSDGSIAATLDDGTLLAAIRRLRRWHDEVGRCS